MTAILRTHFSCSEVYNKLYELVKYNLFFKVKFNVKYKQIQHILYLPKVTLPTSGFIRVFVTDQKIRFGVFNVL